MRNYALQFYDAAVGSGESSPNAIPPDQSRIIATPKDEPGGYIAECFAIDTGSLDVTGWVKDSTSNLWLPITSTTTLTGASPALRFPVPAGGQLFFQYGTNTGVTKFGIGFLANSSPAQSASVANVAQERSGNLATIATAVTTKTHTFTTALVASKVLKAAACTVYECELKIDQSAPSGTYYVLLIDNPTLPANGAVTLLACMPVVHANGVDDQITIPIKNGITAATGAVLALSTTAATLTISGAYLWEFGGEAG